MKDKKVIDEMFSEEGPQFEVWNHLESGLDQARWELHALSERWGATY